MFIQFTLIWTQNPYLRLLYLLDHSFNFLNISPNKTKIMKVSKIFKWIFVILQGSYFGQEIQPYWFL